MTLVRMHHYLALIACGLITLLALSQCKQEKPAEITLSSPVVTLTSTSKEATVKVTSTSDWLIKGGDRSFGGRFMYFDWCVIGPYGGKPGASDICIRLLESNVPTKEESLTIQLYARDGSSPASLTVKYRP